MIKNYLTCERYLENYNKGEKTVAGILDTPQHVCVTETDMNQETVFYDDYGQKVPRRVNHYLVGPIADALHAYEELGYSPEELKEIVEKYKELKRRVLYISTATSSAYGTLGSPFEKKFREMREELERSKRIREYLEADVESLYPQTIFKTNILNKNHTTIKERKMENKNFTKADLKTGYVVKLRCGELRMVMPYDTGELIFINESEQYKVLDRYDENLLRKARVDEKYDVTEVYGRSECRFMAMRISAEGRKLLWKREEKTCDQCIHKVVCTHVGMCEHFAEKN